MSSIKRNFFYNLIYQVFTILTPLITAPYLARVLGPDGLGQYSYTFTVAEYFVYFALLGVANYGNRTIASTRSEDKSRVFIEIYTVQLCVSLLVFIFYLSFALIMNEKYKLLTIIQSLYVLSSVFDVTWYFFGEEKFKSTTIRNVIVKLTALVMIFLLVKKSTDVWKYTLIMALSYFISQTAMWVIIRKEISFCRPQKEKMISHFKSMLVLFIPVIAVTLYKMMDKIMLENLGSVIELGYYESAEKLVRVPALIIAALGTSLLPRMSRMFSHGQEKKMQEYFSVSTELAGFLTFGMSFGLIAVAETFIPLYYGQEFNLSIQLLQMLSLTLLFTSWASAIRNQYLLPLKRDKEYIVSVFMGAFMNLVLNAILIPPLGASGAVIATIGAEAAVAVIQTVSVKKDLEIHTYLKNYVLYCFPGLVMTLVLLNISPVIAKSVVGLLMMIALGIVLYLIFSAVLMIIVKNKLYIIFKSYTTKRSHYEK